MAQHDYTIDGTQTRTNYAIDINNVMQAIATNNSGATAPSTTYPYQYWVDTATGSLKQRNAANSGWNIIMPLFAKPVDPQTNGFRLGVVSGDPYATGTSVGNLYLTPVKGNQIALYDSTNSFWKIYELTEQTIALSCTASNNYDIFAYDNGSGTVVFEQIIWTNATTRATALVKQDGVWVKSGSTNKRYIGSYRGTGTNQTTHNERQRLVFNANNQALQKVYRANTAVANYTYNSATIRQANAETTAQIDLMVGLSEHRIQLLLNAVVQAGSGNNVVMALVQDSTTAFAAGSNASSAFFQGGVTGSAIAIFNTQPSVGYHYYAHVEWCANATAAATMYNIAGPLNSQLTSIDGSWMC